jgi:hypothetical protein
MYSPRASHTSPAIANPALPPPRSAEVRSSVGAAPFCGESFGRRLAQ